MMRKQASPLDFKNLLDESVKIHGHLCPGQVLGVRMSILGLKLTGIEDPKVKDKKDIMPGKPLKRVKCNECGEYVQDGREIYSSGKPICHACSGGAYYK